MWMDPAEDEQNRAWTRGFHDAMQRFGLNMALPNFIQADEGDMRLRDIYGEEKYARLLELKKKWDPDNLFRLNQNIDPSA